jgi:ElaB/YqjD/DUF883 family membrane-anchored ribosome-binding protein
MGEDTRTSSTAVSDTQEADYVRHEIEETRRELGETVAALAEKTDIKAQTKRRAAETKASLQERRRRVLASVKQTSPKSAVSATSRVSAKSREEPLPFVAVAAFAVGALVGAAIAGKG